MTISWFIGSNVLDICSGFQKLFELMLLPIGNPSIEPSAFFAESRINTHDKFISGEKDLHALRLVLKCLLTMNKSAGKLQQLFKSKNHSDSRNIDSPG